jgi:hypothetical protein
VYVTGRPLDDRVSTYGIAALCLALLGRAAGLLGLLALLGRAPRLLAPTAMVIAVAIGPRGNRRTGQYECHGRHGAQQTIDHHDAFSLSFIVSSTRCAAQWTL